MKSFRGKDEIVFSNTKPQVEISPRLKRENRNLKKKKMKQRKIKL